MRRWSSRRGPFFEAETTKPEDDDDDDDGKTTTTGRDDDGTPPRGIITSTRTTLTNTQRGFCAVGIQHNSVTKCSSFFQDINWIQRDTNVTTQESKKTLRESLCVRFWCSVEKGDFGAFDLSLSLSLSCSKWWSLLLCTQTHGKGCA